MKKTYSPRTYQYMAAFSLAAFAALATIGFRFLKLQKGTFDKGQRPTPDKVDEASRESFPASDSPAW